MSVEVYTDHIGVVYYSNAELNIAEGDFPSTCQFFGSPCQVWDTYGNHGFWLGFMDPPTPSTVRYEIVKFDQNQGCSFIHSSQLVFN